MTMRNKLGKAIVGLFLGSRQIRCPLKDWVAARDV